MIVLTLNIFPPGESSSGLPQVPLELCERLKSRADLAPEACARRMASPGSHNLAAQPVVIADMSRNSPPEGDAHHALDLICESPYIFDICLLEFNSECFSHISSG